MHIISIKTPKKKEQTNKQTIKKKYLLTIFLIYFSSQPFTMTVKNGTLFCRKIFELIWVVIRYGRILSLFYYKTAKVKVGTK